MVYNLLGFNEKLNSKNQIEDRILHFFRVHSSKCTVCNRDFVIKIIPGQHLMCAVSFRKLLGAKSRKNYIASLIDSVVIPKYTDLHLCDNLAQKQHSTLYSQDRFTRVSEISIFCCFSNI